MSHTPNFLRIQESASPRRPRRFRRPIVIAVVALVVVLLGWAAWVAIAAGGVVSAVLDGKTSLDRAQEAMVILDFPAAEQALEEADAAFIRAERRLVALDTVRAFPFIGAYADASRAGVRSGRELSEALLTLVKLGGELVRLSGLSEQDLQNLSQGIGPRVTFNDLSTETKRTMLRRLAASADQLDDVSARLAIAQAELAHVDRTRVPYAERFLVALDPTVKKLAEAEEAVRLLAHAARLLPSFAGLDSPQTSLLLFLNDTELRPGGGFIGTYGVLTMKDGDIASLDTKDVYAIDGAAADLVTVVPPPPIVRYLGVPKWFFRDANWSPDFGVSAEKALTLFNQERHAIGQAGPDPVHVVGFTTAFAADLLRLTGPIAVGGQTFTADNAADLIEYQVEIGYVGLGIPLAQRKEILADLVDEMRSRLESLPASKWGELAKVLERNIDTKHLLVWSADPTTQRTAAAVGWSGQVLPPVWGDAQMVVDANLASLKTDPVVKRTIAYEITKDGRGQFIGRTRIRYEHNGSFDWKTTRYRTYVRLYVPKGSAFIRSTGTLQDDKIKNPSGTVGAVDVFEDLGFTAFGAFTSIEPGQTREVMFEYALAPSVVDAIRSGSYRLVEFKQAGAAAHGLTLTLDLGKKLTDALPSEEASEWGDAVYKFETTLDQDRTFQVSL